VPSPAVGIVRIRDGVLFETVADEAVFLHLDSGVYYGLDPIGARMFSLLQARDDEALVVEQLEREYEANAEVIARDVGILVDDLVRRGLVERLGGEGSAPGPGDAASSPEVDAPPSH